LVDVEASLTQRGTYFNQTLRQGKLEVALAERFAVLQAEGRLEILPGHAANQNLQYADSDDEVGG
jgi:hypothetical protein